MIVAAILKIIALSAIICAYLVWRYPIRRTILDHHRFKLFGLRTKLYEMGYSGKIEFNNELYRAVENRLNLLIRYAHRLTFPYMLLGAFAYKFWPERLQKASTSQGMESVIDVYEKGYVIDHVLFKELYAIEMKANRETFSFISKYACFNVSFWLYSAIRAYLLSARRSSESINLAWVNRDLTIAEELERREGKATLNQKQTAFTI